MRVAYDVLQCVAVCYTDMTCCSMLQRDFAWLRYCEVNFCTYIYIYDTYMNL